MSPPQFYNNHSIVAFCVLGLLLFAFTFSVQAMSNSGSCCVHVAHYFTYPSHNICMWMLILSIAPYIYPVQLLSDALPAATVFPEDVEDFASQAWLPRFNKALGVDHQSARLPVLMTSHYILRSWWQRPSRASVNFKSLQSVAKIHNREKNTVGSTLCKKWAQCCIM